MRSAMISMALMAASIPALALGQPDPQPAPAATATPASPAEASPKPADPAALVAEGERLFKTTGCGACHSIDGARRIGPSIHRLYGSTRTLTTGEQVVADDTYLRTALIAPMKQILTGYPPSMPSYAGQLKPAQLDALVAYMKSLGAEKPAAGTPAAPGR